LGLVLPQQNHLSRDVIKNPRRQHPVELIAFAAIHSFHQANIHLMTSPAPTDNTAPASGLFANATLLLTLTTLFWGGNAVAGKFAVGEVSPFILTAARWLLAAIILLVIARNHLRQDWPEIRSRLPYLFVLGACGFALFNIMLYSSLNYTTAINVTIIQSAMPMMVFILNFIVFRTNLHWAQVFGYAVTLAGVLLTAFAGDISQLTGFSLNKGDILMLLATFVYAAYSVALRSRPNIHWLSFITTIVCAASLTSLVAATVEITNGTAIWPTSFTAWAVILYTTIFPSIIGQIFFARGVELFGSNRAGIFINLVPIFGSILAVLLLGEQFHFYHGFALALVIGGITIAQNLTPKTSG
jgi:drug/metabolite transporter (DMT)-like permease